MPAKQKPNQHPTNFLAFTLIGWTFILTFFKLKTFDVWTLMTGGKLWLQHPTLKFVDEISYSVPGQPWINQEWLGEVIMFLIYNIAGAAGLISFKTILVSAMILLIFKHMKDRGANVYVIFWVLFLTVFLCRFRLTVRPQVISFLLLTILSQYLYHLKVGKIKHIWYVVPLMTVWTNIHFGSLIGLILLGIYTVASFLTAYLPNYFGNHADTPAAKRLFRHLIAVFGLSVVACMIGPAGLHYFTMPLEAAYLSVKYKVIECMPPRAFPLQLFPLFWCTLTGYTILIFSRVRKIDVYDMLIFLVTAALALKMVRFIAIFAILCAPVVIAQLSGLLTDRKFPKGLSKVATNHILIVIISMGLVACLVNSKKGPLRKYELGFGVKQDLQPYGAVDFLKTNKVDGNIFNDINWGGFISFHRNPDNKIFMNSRYTVFGDIIFETYYRVLAGVEEWEMILDQYNTDIVLLSRKLASKAKLTALLSASNRWRLVYVDGQSFLFVKDKPKFKELIQIFEYNVKVQVAR